MSIETIFNDWCSNNISSSNYGDAEDVGIINSYKDQFTKYATAKGYSLDQIEAHLGLSTEEAIKEYITSIVDAEVDRLVSKDNS